ncbi:hypothetical protein LCGC14_2887950, partial [marine sediment metagenome]
GLNIVLKKDGLFSFNERGLSRLIFEDFNVTTSLDQLAMVPWFEGLVIGAPQGIFYYVLGERPINIGFAGRLNDGLPPPGVTELLSGRFLGVATHGSFLFTIYQLDPTSTSALVLYTEAKADPGESELQWNSLGSITLDTASRFAGITVADSGFPTSSAETVPSLWFSNVGDPRHITLNPVGGPIRSRADTHKITTSGEAWFSELIFTEPVDLTGLVVVASRDMIAGDEWQISMVVNGTGTETAKHWFKSGGRHVRPLNQTSVHRLSLRIEFTGTSTADRVPPALQSIELFGSPSTGDREE